MNLLFSEEATDFKARSIALASDDKAPIVIPENPPWLNQKPTFNFELTQHKKSETNPVLIQQHFAEISCFNIQTLNWRRSERSK
jgi:hypothetical protein